MAPVDTATGISFTAGEAQLNVVCGEAVWVGWVRDRFGAFESSGPPCWEIRYSVESGVPGFLGDPRDVAGPEIQVECAGDRLRLDGPHFHADVDLTAHAVTAAGPAALYPLDAILKVLLPLMHPDGLVLHAAALCDGARGWICSGPSGAGKSTLATLAGEGAVCDELVVVSNGSGHWRLLSLPFWNGRPASAPLTAIHLLEHGHSHTRRRAAAAEAVRRLATEALPPLQPAHALDAWFARLVQLVEQVPVFNLTFKPTPDVWDFIREPC
jgi:hypothetical protein